MYRHTEADLDNDILIRQLRATFSVLFIEHLFEQDRLTMVKRTYELSIV